MTWAHPSGRYAFKLHTLRVQTVAFRLCPWIQSHWNTKCWGILTDTFALILFPTWVQKLCYGWRESREWRLLVSHTLYNTSTRWIGSNLILIFYFLINTSFCMLPFLFYFSLHPFFFFFIPKYFTDTILYSQCNLCMLLPFASTFLFLTNLCHVACVTISLTRPFFFVSFNGIF